MWNLIRGDIPGDEESSIKSSLAIDALKPKDLKSIEDVDQSCKKQTLLKNGRGIDKNFEIDKFNSLKLSPTAYWFWKTFAQKWSNFDVKSLINSEVMILYLDALVRITSHVQTLILDLISTPHEV